MNPKLNKLIVQNEDGEIEITAEMEALIEATTGRSQRDAARWMAENGFPEYLNSKGQPIQGRVQRRLNALKEAFVDRALDQYEDKVAVELMDIQRVVRQAWEDHSRAASAKEAAQLLNVILKAFSLRADILGLRDAQKTTNNNELTVVTMNLNPKSQS